MHYKNGKEAKTGDKVVVQDQYGTIQTGIVVETIAGSEACNLYIVPLDTQQQLVTAAEALPITDAVIESKPE